MRVNSEGSGRQRQMSLLETAPLRPVTLTETQRHQLQVALAELLLSVAHSPAEANENGGNDVVEDYS
jgi:hypothetical protein